MANFGWTLDDVKKKAEKQSKNKKAMGWFQSFSGGESPVNNSLINTGTGSSVSADGGTGMVGSVSEDYNSSEENNMYKGPFLSVEDTRVYQYIDELGYSDAVEYGCGENCGKVFGDHTTLEQLRDALYDEYDLYFDIEDNYYCDDDITKYTFDDIGDDPEVEVTAYSSPFRSFGEDWEADDYTDDTDDRYVYIVSKTVYDADGFTTDYTMYYDTLEDKYIMIFGDCELYNPSNTEPDAEFDTNEEAVEWYNNFEGIDDSGFDFDECIHPVNIQAQEGGPTHPYDVDEDFDACDLEDDEEDKDFFHLDESFFKKGTQYLTEAVKDLADLDDAFTELTAQQRKQVQDAINDKYSRDFTSKKGGVRVKLGTKNDKETGKVVPVLKTSYLAPKGEKVRRNELTREKSKAEIYKGKIETSVAKDTQKAILNVLKQTQKAQSKDVQQYTKDREKTQKAQDKIQSEKDKLAQKMSKASGGASPVDKEGNYKLTSLQSVISELDDNAIEEIENKFSSSYKSKDKNVTVTPHLDKNSSYLSLEFIKAPAELDDGGKAQYLGTIGQDAEEQLMSLVSNAGNKSDKLSKLDKKKRDALLKNNYKKVQKLQKKIDKQQNESYIVGGKRVYLTESEMSELDLAMREDGFLNRQKETIKALRDELKFLRTQAPREIKKGGAFDSQEEIDYAIETTQRELNREEAIYKIAARKMGVEESMKRLREADEDIDINQLFDEFKRDAGYFNGDTYILYADYSDFISPDDVIDILESPTPRDTFYEQLDDAFYYAEAETKDEIIEEFKKFLYHKGVDAEAVDTDAVYDLFGVEPDYDHYLKHEYRCRLVVDTGDSNYDFTVNPGYHNEYKGNHGDGDGEGIGDPASLAWLAHQQGYSDEQLQKALDGDAQGSKFLASALNEAQNTTSSMNALVFLCTATLDDLIKQREEKTGVKISKSAVCGLFDPWNGGGSVLDINLEQDVTVPDDYIFEFVPDVRSSHGYSVDEVYGLSGGAYDTRAVLV